MASIPWYIFAAYVTSDSDLASESDPKCVRAGAELKFKNPVPASGLDTSRTLRKQNVIILLTARLFGLKQSRLMFNMSETNLPLALLLFHEHPG